MWKLKNIETGELIECPEKPVFLAGIWECGLFRITDASGSEYEIIDPPVTPPKLSPVEFKLLFTAEERIAIKTSDNPVVKDFFELVENQRIVNAADQNRGLIDFGLQSTQDALHYMQSIGLLTAGRVNEIISGVVK